MFFFSGNTCCCVTTCHPSLYICCAVAFAILQWHNIERGQRKLHCCVVWYDLISGYLFSFHTKWTHHNQLCMPPPRVILLFLFSACLCQECSGCKTENWLTRIFIEGRKAYIQNRQSASTFGLQPAFTFSFGRRKVFINMFHRFTGGNFPEQPWIKVCVQHDIFSGQGIQIHLLGRKAST